MKILKLRKSTNYKNNVFVYEGFLDTFYGDFTTDKIKPEDNKDTGYGHKRYLPMFMVIFGDQYGDMNDYQYIDNMDEVISYVGKMGYNKIYVK
jgi:hypothetical protein